MSEMVKLSDDGPMRLMHFSFIKVVLACLNLQPDSELKREIIAGIPRNVPWANFVQQIIDGKIDCDFGKLFFRNASVLSGEDGKYDYLLERSAILECLERFDDTLSENYGALLSQFEELE